MEGGGGRERGQYWFLKTHPLLSLILIPFLFPPQTYNEAANVLYSSDGLSVLGHSLHVSVQTGCALQLWHQSNVHQTWQRSFWISSIWCVTKPCRYRMWGKRFERILEQQRGAIFSSHVPLRMLIPDSAWVPSDVVGPPVKQSDACRPNERGPPGRPLMRGQMVGWETGGMLSLQTQPASLKAWSTPTSAPEIITRA